jgi:hypothetical protein
MRWNDLLESTLRFFQRFVMNSYDEAAPKDYRPRWYIGRGIFLPRWAQGAAGTFPNKLECGVSGE